MDRERIKQQTDIVRLIESSGVILKGVTTLSGVCPFHEDRKPSLKVEPQKQWWWCYGCSEGGDCFNWVMKRDECDFKTALKSLNNGNISVPIYRKPVSKVNLSPISDDTVNCYHINLIYNDKALSWLWDNRRWSKETIIKYNIGLDKEAYRFTIPIPSIMTREWLDIRYYDALKRWEQKMLPHQPGISNLPYLLDNGDDYIVLVEGEPDALALASLGISVATNTCGVMSAYKTWREWYGLIANKDIIICFDLDEPGKAATQQLKALFPDARAAILPSTLGVGGDCTDAIAKYGAQWFTEFIFGGF